MSGKMSLIFMILLKWNVEKSQKNLQFLGVGITISVKQMTFSNSLIIHQVVTKIEKIYQVSVSSDFQTPRIWSKILL